MPRPLGLTSTAADPFDPAMHAKRNDRYLTPLPFIAKLGKFDLDPCGAPGHATAGEVWTPEEVGDGLSLPWHGRVWLNPPYGRTMGDWVRALIRHGSGVALIPCAPDTKLWHDDIFPAASAVLFVKGRMHFEGVTHPSNHPSAVVAFSFEDAKALAVSGLGKVLS
jgi:hypothetical protein